MSPTPQQRRAARHQQPGDASTPAARRGPSGGAKKPITVEAIISTAFGIVENEGYQALTMRRVATALETGPSSLYAHVVNKEDLDELLIGRLCAEIDLPEPDPATWRQQITSICTELRDQYLRYPGISQAAFAVAPSNLDTLRVSEGTLAILLAGGVDPQAAAWATDSLTLYVNAYSLEISLVNQQRRHGDGSWVVSRDELLRRFAALPGTFPHTKRYAAELTAGTGHDRFDFTIGLMIDGLARRLGNAGLDRLQALSGVVGVPAMVNVQDGYRLGVVIDGVPHTVFAAPGSPVTREWAAQRCADSARFRSERPVDELKARPSDGFR